MQTDLEYSVLMDSGVVIYITGLIKFVSGIQKYIRRDTVIHSQQSDLICPF